MAKVYHHLFKVILIGDSDTGKAELLVKFAQNGKLSEEFVSTIGVDFKTIDIVENGKTVRLQLWDSAGQEKFHSVTSEYYRGARGIFLVYDVTSEISFNSITQWMVDVRKNAPEDSVVILLANNGHFQNDERQVTWARGRALAQELGIRFFEVSKVTGTNINEVLHTISRDILNKEKHIINITSKPSNTSGKSQCALQ